MTARFASPVSELLNAVRQNSLVDLYGQAGCPGAGVPSTGVGLRGTPAMRPNHPLPDWLIASIAAPEAVPAYEAVDLALVVHWPTFLMRAFRETDAYASAARRFLLRTLPMLGRADPVLAEYFRQAPKKDAAALFAQEARTHAVSLHVDALFARASSRKELLKEFQRAFRGMTDLVQETKFQRCMGCLKTVHTAMCAGSVVVETMESIGRCFACAQRRDGAAEFSVIELRYVTRPKSCQYVMGKPRFGTAKAELGDAVARDLAWIIHGLTPYDGSWAVDRSIVVDWRSYGRRIAERLVGVPPAEFSAMLSQRTVLPAPQHTEALRALSTPDRLLTHTESELNSLAESVGFAVRDYIDARVAKHGNPPGVDAPGREGLLPWQSVYASSALRRFYEASTSLAVRHRIRGARAYRAPPGSRRNRRYVQEVFETVRGPLNTYVRKHGKAWAALLHIPETPGTALPRTIQRQQSVHGPDADCWWALEDLATLSRACIARGLMDHAEYIDSLWRCLKSASSKYLGNPALYRENLRSVAQAKRKDEVVAGTRQSLGRFTLAEEDTLRTFLYQRSAQESGRALRGPFTETEWLRIEALVPFRTRETIKTKVHILGLAYAKQYGYVAYLASGFCIGKSSHRRTAWLRKGVKL